MPPETEWARSFGGAFDEVGTAIVLDVDGSAIFGGGYNEINFDGDVQFANSQGDDAFFAKLDRDGELVWFKVFGGVGSDRVFDLAVDSTTGRIAVVGLFEDRIDFGSGEMLDGSDEGRSVFVAVFEPDRSLRWAQVIAGNDALPDAGGLSTDFVNVAFREGGVVVTGPLLGTMGFPGRDVLSATGDASFYVLRLDANGMQPSVTTASIDGGAVTLETAAGVVGVEVASDGEVVVAGTFAGELSVDGGPSITAEGTLPDAFLLRLPPTGAPSLVSWGGEGAQIVTSMSMLANDDVILGGATVAAPMLNRADLFVARIDRDGVEQASAVFEGTPDPNLADAEFSFVRTLDVDSAGDVVVAGTLWGGLKVGDTTLTQSPTDNYDIFVLRLDEQLAPQSVRQYGDPNFEFVLDSALDDAGRILLTGVYAGQLRISEESLNSVAGSPDAFVAKLVVEE